MEILTLTEARCRHARLIRVDCSSPSEQIIPMLKRLSSSLPKTDNTRHPIVFRVTLGRQSCDLRLGKNLVAEPTDQVLELLQGMFGLESVSVSYE